MSEPIIFIDSSEILEMKVAGPVFKQFAELLDLSGIEIYGRPSHDLVERLRLKAQMLGSGNVTVHELHAGFARFGVPTLDTPDSP